MIVCVGTEEESIEDELLPWRAEYAETRLGTAANGAGLDCVKSPSRPVILLRFEGAVFGRALSSGGSESSAASIWCSLWSEMAVFKDRTFSSSLELSAESGLPPVRENWGRHDDGSIKFGG